MVRKAYDRIRERFPELGDALERDDLWRAMGRDWCIRATRSRFPHPPGWQRSVRGLPISCIPVDMMTGFPLAAMWRMNGRWSASPEPILKAGTSCSSRKSAAARENGVEM